MEDMIWIHKLKKGGRLSSKMRGEPRRSLERNSGKETIQSEEGEKRKSGTP